MSTEATHNLAELIGCLSNTVLEELDAMLKEHGLDLGSPEIDMIAQQALQAALARLSTGATSFLLPVN